MEDQIIQNMRLGESKRDAGSKIRGYLFQDLVAIDELIKEDTKYICVEYIEDVITITKEAVCIIQAKYYPASTINKKDVAKDLFYQYLRFKLYNYSGKIVPILAAHTNEKVGEINVSHVVDKKINLDDSKEEKKILDINKWLKENIYELNKPEAENKLFNHFAMKKSIDGFLDNLQVQDNYKDLKQYRNEITEKLKNLVVSESKKLKYEGIDKEKFDDERWENILIGLAVQYIQERYNELKEKENLLLHRKCEREDFIKYLLGNIDKKSNKDIGAYLRVVVIDCFHEIVKNNSQLTIQQNNILECMRDYTANWFFRLGSTIEGQYQLLNTVSRKDREEFEKFFNKSIDKRLTMMHEHRSEIHIFLRYLWKIILNVNKEVINRGVEDINLEDLKPENYFDSKEKRFLNVDFSEDRIDSAIILSTPDQACEEEHLSNLLERMKEIRPKKWYMCGTRRGVFSYEQQVLGKTSMTVSAIEEEAFFIKCMKCINVDKGGWNQFEECTETIFRLECSNNKEDGDE